nr:zinc finger BED domain-containing protein RICESLEEPER 2-like [Ipomoea batatas]
MSTMAYEMKKKFDKYWEGLEINKLLIVSSVLDPRSKMSFVTICFERLYGKDTPKCMEMKEAIVEVLRKLYEVYSVLHVKPSGDVGVTIGDVVPIPNLFTTYTNMVREKGNVEKTSNELDIYLMENIEMPTSNRLGGMELKQQRNGKVAKNFSDLNNGSKKDLAASTIDRRPLIHCSAASLGEKKFAAASASNVDIENRVRQWQAQQSWRQTAKINFGDFHASTSSESDEAMKNPTPNGVGGYVADSSLLSNGVTQS